MGKTVVEHTDIVRNNRLYAVVTVDRKLEQHPHAGRYVTSVASYHRDDDNTGEWEELHWACNRSVADARAHHRNVVRSWNPGNNEGGDE